MMDFLRRYVFHNLGLKLVSLLIAVLLWTAIARQPVAEIAINVPIEFVNAPSDLEISSEAIPQIQVRLRGYSGVLRDMKASQIHASIDLSNARPGERTYDLPTSRIHAPREVEVEEVIPSQFRISFDTRSTRSVSVVPRVIGTSAPGYRLQEVTVDPPNVAVAGPAHRLDNLQSVNTDPVDASGVIGHATFSTHAYVSDPMLRLVTPSTVHVTVVTAK
jgi:YbbR domain-containing protein